MLLRTRIFLMTSSPGWSCSRRTCILCGAVGAVIALVIYSLTLTCCVLISSGLKKALRNGNSIIIFNPRNADVISNVIEVNHIQTSGAGSEYDLENNRDYILHNPSDHLVINNIQHSRVFNNAYDDYSDAEREYFDRKLANDKEHISTTPDAHVEEGVLNHDEGVQKLPQTLIIGVKKGGTRALLEFLRVHPDIRGPGPEIHFFDKFYKKGLEWYRSQMPATLDDQMTVEKTPSYFVTRGVPERVFNMSSDTKLLIVVRDPVTRAISDYTQAVSKRGFGGKPFEEMVFLESPKVERAFPACAHCGLVDTRWGAIRIGQYARHLEMWLKYFPLEQIHFINGENLVTNPADELNKVQDFLELKRVISEKHFYFNSTKGFPCLKKPESSGNPHCLGKTKGRQHPDIDPKVIKRLKDFYRPFNAKFYQITGQMFGWE